MYQGLFSTFYGGFGQRSSIDDLLDDEELTLDKLLEDNEVLNEVRLGNKRLVEFFSRQRVRTMLSYIIEMPTEEDSHNRAHKFPFITSEIFGADVGAIYD
jgi:serine/threonine-protein phosphatase 6 regulatory subunit 3